MGRCDDRIALIVVRHLKSLSESGEVVEPMHWFFDIICLFCQIVKNEVVMK